MSLGFREISERLRLLSNKKGRPCVGRPFCVSVQNVSSEAALCSGLAGAAGEQNGCAADGEQCGTCCQGTEALTLSLIHI